MLLKTFFTCIVLACLLLPGLGLEGEKRKAKRVKASQTGKEVGPNKRAKEGTAHRNGTEAGGVKVGRGPSNDATCTSVGGICQRKTYICQGRYLKDRCTGSGTRECCMSGSGAWDALCSGHHQNRIRGCDKFGCGAFNSKRGGKIHKAVDVVCDDYSFVNAPFSGILGGPASRVGDDGGVQYDGVKLSNSEYCVKIFNMRPYRYLGGISRGEALGYLLPLQERFSGITSHLELQMCDRSDPSTFI
ncbi:myeloid protein 1-like [Megalops cyprinoides]|uniref:myeloid protein 1-like n=1 Tax=Megalops cyprinoides TaxID=118141 RepID=UPI0018653B2D|nr:myeloid protein 1-like [Megalops cyprinoides]